MAKKISIICLLIVFAVSVNAGFQDYHAAIMGRQNTVSIPAECSYVVLILSACQILSPGFVSLTPESKAPCLCYSDTAWAPQLFDGAIETCASWAQSADPADYSGLVTYEGICTSVGDILSVNHIAPGVGTTTPVPAPSPQPVTPSPTPTTPPPPPVVETTLAPTPTPTPTQPPPVVTSSPSSSDLGIRVNPGCAIVGSALTFCESATPGFTSLLPQQMATCLCYSSTVWSPNGFDGPVSTCAEFVKTASPTDYPVISGLGGFCTALGDVIHSGGSGAANTGKPLFNTDAPILGLTSKASSLTPSITRSSGSAAATPQPTTVTLIPTTTASSSSNLRKSPLDGMMKALLLSSLAMILSLLVVL